MDKQFLLKSNTAVQEFDFSYPVISIGSHPDNDIVLPGGSSLAFHATLHLQDGLFHLIALGGASTIRVDGIPLAASPVRVSENQRVEIGNYALAFRQNGSPESVHVTLTQAPASSSADSAAFIPQGESPILVNAPVELVEIDVEQSASYELEIINAGPIVAAFFVSLNGVPDEWLEISPRMVNLNEGQRARVRISITPPRDPSSVAGKHSLQAQVQSPNYGGHTVQTALTLVIRPYYEFMIGSLAPKDQRIYWGKRNGQAQLPIANHGNSPAEFTVSAIDDENGCVFDLLVNENTPLTRQATVGVAAGELFNLPIQVTPHKRRLFAFSSKRYPYTTTVQSPQGISQMTSGSVSAVPLFGWWSIMLVLVLVGVGLFLLLQPNIYSFQVASGKDIIELGDTTRLEWSVSPFATNVSISGVDQAINRGQTSLTLAPARSTTYEIVSGNWLSGLLRIDQRRSLTVLVVPPSPRINVFDVGETSVARGKPVMVRWSVTRAEQAFLTIDEVVYELPKEEFSGEKEVILTKDSLVTIEATNASGSELRSYFVNVAEPNITVRTFTVWVRPEANARLEPKGGNKLFSVLNIPDPNFPEKYVELVTDRNSDSGYRVEFYQPERELSKGEQVMIEWNIEGTDNGKIQIAPFTDALPARGSQPFFPQESMNFVMTAKSGELEQLFMLPVKVFDGTPPTAPKIEFFRASPLSAVGPSDVQFAWSVSGNWTRVQLSTEGTVVADYVNPQGFRSVRVGKSTTYILTAWNGNLSSAAPVEITINPALIDPGLIVTSISPSTGRAQVGSKIIVTVDFSSIPNGSAYPTGIVIVTDGSSTCTISLPALNCTLQFATSGTKTISASFPGDKIYSQSKSPNFSQQVVVASSQVELIPSFYFVGNNTPIAVESTKFDMDKGMRTLVEVRPRNTTLADNKGTVSLSLCEQDANEAIIESSCVFVGSAQVKVAATTANGQTEGYGYADITIQNFKSSGLHSLLFEYTHSENAIDPADFVQPNISINRTRILLSLSNCSNPDTLTSCTYGLTSGATTSEIIFDIKVFRSPDPILLSTLLPAPEIDAFTITSNNSATWDCAIKPRSGTYKLICNVSGLASGTTYTVSYGYDNTNPLPPSDTRNDYYMGQDPAISFGTPTFQLSVLTSTKVVIGDLSGIKVGERIQLTGPNGGLVSILSGTSPVSPIPSTGMTLTEKSGADIFGIEDEGVNCVRDATDNSKIIVTAANADCYIYFKHVGNYTLTAAFEGTTALNSATSSDVPLEVTQQTEISAELQYRDSGNFTTTFPANFTTNEKAFIRTVLNGPASNFSPDDTSFPPTALADRKLLLTLNPWGATNCVVDTDSLVTDLSGGIYEVTITQKSIGDPSGGVFVTAADFNITCSIQSTLGVSFNLTFSDKTTPKKDSDDFRFSTPVNRPSTAVSPPGVGTLSASIKRNDTPGTNMLSGTTISELNFGQRYTIGIDNTSNIKAPYNYVVKYTYTTICPLGITCLPPSFTNNINPSVAASNARNSVLNTYNANVKWSIDPSNFLSKGTNLGIGTSTCGANMPLTVQDVSNNSYSEYSQWSYIFNQSYGYWDGFNYIIVQVYENNTNGSMTLQLKTTDAQKCTILFDSSGTTNEIVTDTSGTIAISATSGNGLFDVTNTYTVNGIDKQAVSMTFNPATGSISGYAQVPLSLGVTLASSDISGGTVLPFVGTTFAGSFSPSLDSTCPNLSQIGNIAQNGSISQTFTSTSDYLQCNNELRYLGNKYYKEVPNTVQPGMVFAKHDSSVSFTAALPFGNTNATGAFTDIPYSNLKIRVSDADTPAHSSLIPTGNVKLEVYKSNNTAYACSDYTLTITPSVTCSSNAYTLPLTNGETAAFSIQFKSTMLGTGNYFKLSYVPGSNNIFNASENNNYPFTVKKHSTSVNFSTTPTFITNGTTTDTASYTGLVIRVRDNDQGHNHPSLIPAGTVKVELVGTGNTIYKCSGTTPDYEISSTTCQTDSGGDFYLLTLNGSLNTDAFVLYFKSNLVAGNGYYFRLTYTSTSDDFSGSTTNTGTFSVTE
ncbi:MAG: hypothetical protein L6461_02130 [Anaerolineae bacterium]|nr:hypothetical protein [Anaerolineae bacterium]